MITLFTIPKPFDGHIGVIQHNALRSWKALIPACEVILFGDEGGIEEAARTYGMKHVRDLERNGFGTPMLHAAFRQAAAMASNRILCYINADIILPPDTTRILASIPYRKYLLVGRRINVDITEPLELRDASVMGGVIARVASDGVMDSHGAIDYFVFTRESGLHEILPFAVGRPWWDQWFIFNARRKGIPVIDATLRLPVIHQNHGYGHVPQRQGGRWDGPEANQNKRLAVNDMGGTHYGFSVYDATHYLPRDGSGPKRALRRPYLPYRLRDFRILHPGLAPFINVLSGLKATLVRR